jgi:hypothetical protein
MTPNFVLGKMQSWNLTIEHQFSTNWLLRAAYVGTEAYHIPIGMDLNPGYYSAGSARLNYADFGELYAYQSENTASYNGLQITGEKRFSRGFQLSSNYTWSKSLDAQSMSELPWGAFVGDPFNLRWNRGVSDQNFTNIWSNTFVWQTPSLRQYGNKFLTLGLGNWETSGIVDFTSGVPFSIAGGFGNNNSGALQYADRADLTGQPIDAHQGSQGHWLDEYFNTAAFRTNAAGTFGDSPRNTLKGPGLAQVNLMIAKNFPFKERYRAQFRWEMFNAFNSPVFSTPVNDPSSPAFAEIVSSANTGGFGFVGTPRIMQLALKLFW